MFKTILQTESRRAKAAVAVGSVSPLLSFLSENKVKVTEGLIESPLDPGDPPLMPPPPNPAPSATIGIQRRLWLTAHYRLSAWDAKPLPFPGSDKYILCN